jgi:hypothetical protein
VIQSTEPTQVYAGDTLQWTLGPNESIQAGNGTQFDFLFSGPGIMRDYLVGGTGLMQDYPPTAWTLQYVLKSKDQSFAFQSGEITAVAGDYQINVDTTTWAPGKYLLIGYVTKTGGTERHIVRTSLIQVFPNPANDGPIDFRTPARQIYEQILADEARGVFVGEYTVGSRHCRYTTPKERDYMRRVWAHRVAVEEGKLSSFGGVTFSV